MRRWNGWIAEGATVPAIPDTAIRLLHAEIGPGSAPRDATLDAVVASVPRPAPQAVGLPGIAVEPEDRVRHARGQSLPDWVAVRSGRLARIPDGVVRPATDDDVRTLVVEAARRGVTLIPYGGGTSVVGGVTPDPDDQRPAVTVATRALGGLRDLDEASGLATFGAGTVGPDVEAALAPHGLTLGHLPQSWERSTVGGWVATRSAGQESIGYGRIEELFAGGRLESPRGSLVLPPHPASAAGPDLRHLVLGSEGRYGLVTAAILRVVPKPRVEATPAWVIGEWPRAIEAARAIARSGLPLSMVRLSTPIETATTLALGGDGRSVKALRGYLRLRRIGPEPCLLLVGASGEERIVETAVREAGSIVRHNGGFGVGGAPGRQWRRNRFRVPDLREALWQLGYCVDTLETATTWSGVPDLAAELGTVLRHGLEEVGERVHAFSHVSHVYPSGSSLYTTFVFRTAPDPDETLARWRRLKTAASETIVRHGATISHQHGVGRDHRPWLGAEKGDLGVELLRAVAERLDPDRVMNPGVLLPDRSAGTGR